MSTAEEQELAKQRISAFSQTAAYTQLCYVEDEDVQYHAFSRAKKISTVKVTGRHFVMLSPLVDEKTFTFDSLYKWLIWVEVNLNIVTHVEYETNDSQNDSMVFVSPLAT